ncbi:MAG: phage holin family protein [Akkermansiaceae bacterium]|nr:phage holin family protein [Akkermansiaceae bacterium]
MPGEPPDPEPGVPPDDGRAPQPSIGARLHTYLQARLDLFALESKEAAGVVARQGVLGVLLALAAFFAYVLILAAAVSLLGQWLASAWPDAFATVGWEVAALGFGLLHVLAAAAFFLLLRRKPDPPLFEYTRSEFQKDREWLHERQSSKKSGD